MLIVPCYKRVKDMEYNEAEEVPVESGDGDDWVSTHNDGEKGKGFIHNLFPYYLFIYLFIYLSIK